MGNLKEKAAGIIAAAQVVTVASIHGNGYLRRAAPTIRHLVLSLRFF